MEQHDVAFDTEHDDVMVGPDRTSRFGLVAEQAHLHRPHQHRAPRVTQPLRRVDRRTSAGSLAGPIEQVECGVDAEYRVPTERVEPGQEVLAHVHPERRSGQHLDRGRIRRGRAEHHPQRIRVAI
jgi:hypothetical protein